MGSGMTTNSKLLPPPSAIQSIAIGKLYSSPIGPLWVACSPLGLISVEWEMPQADYHHLLEQRYKTIVLYDEISTAEPIHQLGEYLEGHRQQFDLPLDLTGLTAFQTLALRLTMKIPYGQTSTYKDIAVQIGKPNSARAIGRVEATNPIPLVIPCHRILGTDGTLHGYGGPGGIKLKSWLLNT